MGVVAIVYNGIDDTERVGWVTGAGLPAVIARGAAPAKALCGYVGVPEGHPLHGVERIDPQLDVLDVHGAVTFAADHPGAGQLEPLIEEAWAALDGTYWWLGFDAGHSDDMPHNELGEPVRIRDTAYMRQECEQLAAQLATIRPTTEQP